MPYEGERATGDSLWRLEENLSVKEFKGAIRIRSQEVQAARPRTINPPRSVNSIRRIVAIDSSTVTMAVQNGFPMAEASLFNAAVIVIKVDELREFDRNHVPSPSELRDIERVETMSAVLPGQNVAGIGSEQDAPKKFFRETVRREMDFKLDDGHESLLETFHAIASDAITGEATYQCPLDDCGLGEVGKVTRSRADGPCGCHRQALLYSTDSLRMHERFHDYGTCEQAFTAFRMVAEHLLMANIIRYFWQKLPPSCFDRTAFVIDGPLAVFGMPSWLKDHLQAEITRIHGELTRAGRPGLLLMGVEKTGQFVEHFEELDWADADGPRQHLANGTVLVPTSEYVYQHIAPNPSLTKPYGQAVHYGRKPASDRESGGPACEDPLNVVPVLVTTVNCAFVTSESCALHVAGIVPVGEANGEGAARDARLGDTHAVEALSQSWGEQGGVVAALRGESAHDPLLDRVGTTRSGSGCRRDALCGAGAGGAQAGPLRGDH